MPITKRSNRNHVITFNSHLKTIPFFGKCEIQLHHKKIIITAFYLHPVDLCSSDTLHMASFVTNEFLRR